MNPVEILLAESQERMCYEVTPENVERVREIAERFDLGCSVIGEVTTGSYTCTFDGKTVVDVPAEFLADGAPAYDRSAETPTTPDRNLPKTDLETAFETIVGHPNTASREWVYRQYDHEVGLRTALGPGDDSAVLALHETAPETDVEGTGLAVSAGAEPNWTAAAPNRGARAVALENATNLAAKGANPLAAVDCLNGGNPEDSDTYGGFAATVDGLAEICATLDIPVVGGNVSLYNDSTTGPIPPTPTLAMVGTRAGYQAPPTALSGTGELLLVGDRGLADHAGLGGSEYLATFGGTDAFPTLPDRPQELIDTLAAVANRASTLAVHDASHGGLAVALAEMVSSEAGAAVELDGEANPFETLFHEQAGRAVIETDEPAAVRAAFADVAPVASIGRATETGRLDVTVGNRDLSMTAETITTRRAVLDRTMD